MSDKGMTQNSSKDGNSDELGAVNPEKSKIARRLLQFGGGIEDGKSLYFRIFVDSLVLILISLLFVNNIDGIFEFLKPISDTLRRQLPFLPSYFDGLPGVIMFALYPLLIYFIFSLIFRFTGYCSLLFGKVINKPNSDFGDTLMELCQNIASNSKLALAEGGNGNRLLVVIDIDKRLQRLRKRTNVILWAISISLVAAALVVLFAGQLTSIDAAAVNYTDKLKSEIASANRNISNLFLYQNIYKQVDNLNRQIDEISKLKAPDKAQLDKLEKDKQDLIKMLPRESFGLDDVRPRDSEQTALLVQEQEKFKAALLKHYDTAWEKDINGDRGVDRGLSEWRYLIATAITRVGVILIIVFLVQILLGLYRYNTRLSTYYHTVRDTIILWDGKFDKLDEMKELVREPRIDFGKEPKHPLEDIIRGIAGRINDEIEKQKKDNPK